MAGLKPIKLLSARERVIAALRKAILSGELPAGTIVTLDEIASQLEVSNTPVREASATDLRRLSGTAAQPQSGSAEHWSEIHSGSF